jgi:hypothetical protein
VSCGNSHGNIVDASHGIFIIRINVIMGIGIPVIHFDSFGDKGYQTFIYPSVINFVGSDHKREIRMGNLVRRNKYFMYAVVGGSVVAHHGKFHAAVTFPNGIVRIGIRDAYQIGGKFKNGITSDFSHAFSGLLIIL